MYENNLLAMQQEQEKVTSEQAQDFASSGRHQAFKNSKSCLQQNAPSHYHNKYIQQKEQFLCQDNHQLNTIVPHDNTGKVQNKSQLEASKSTPKIQKTQKISDNFLTPDYALQLYQEKQLKTQKKHEDQYTQELVQKDPSFISTLGDFSFDIFQLQHHHLLVCLEKSLVSLI